jgi:2-C-methyl-D-erythritol 2,4-cyclodiphosphate synthase
MRSNIAADLSVTIDRVNVKGTTSEALGFIGRREGIACQAIALIERTP